MKHQIKSALKSRKFKVLQISYMLNVRRLKYIDGSFLYVEVNAHGYTYNFTGL